jgi:UDP-N-acetylmuramate dehydrogenase
MALLADLTTLRLGGPAGRLVDCHTEEALVAAVREADAAGRPLLVLGGGSNLVVADEGFSGTVARVLLRGIECREDGEQVIRQVKAGEPWDALVEACVADELAGIECLSGIPGLTGAIPIQNVGAYGQEVSQTIRTVRAYDRIRREIVELPAGACGFGYRTSVVKRTPGRWVVLAVTFALCPSARSAPVRYAELARALGLEIGDTAPLAAVRDAVLRLRRGKGMVIDPDDPDSVSAGSFFLNPVLSAEQFALLEERVREQLGSDAGPPVFPTPDGQIKTSAAWLVERAGFGRGYGNPAGIAISGKHTLALTNRGGGTTVELLALAREIGAGVRCRFGVELEPEPVFVGLSWR